MRVILATKEILVSLLIIILFALLLSQLHIFYERPIEAIVLLIAVLSIIVCKDVFFGIYQLFFTIFYISPLVFLSDQDISHGLFFRQISLSGNEVSAMTFYLLGSSILFSLVSFSLKPKYSATQIKGINPNKSEWALIIFLFLLIAYSNISKSLIVSEIGYEEYIGKGVPSPKSTIVFLMEAFLVYRLLYFRKNYIALILFVGYCLSGMLSGQRIPYAFMMLAYFVVFFELGKSKKNFIFFFLIIFLLSVPLLMWVQQFRNGIYQVFDLDFLILSYIQVFKVIYLSLDTVKAVFIQSFSSVDYDPFGKFWQYFSLFLQRVMGVDFEFQSVTFGVAFTEAISPDLLAKNVTCASSAPAEFYHLFGMFGAILHVTYAYLICKILIYMSKNFREISFYLTIFTARGFWGMVRGEPFGFLVDTGLWIFLGVFMHSLVKLITKVLRTSSIKKSYDANF